MKYCKNCEISYDSPLNECLLCHNHLDDDGKDINYNYAVYKKTKDTNEFIVKIALLVNVISIILTLYINYSISKELSWSLIVVAANIYLILLFYNVLSKIRTSLKILTTTILTTILVVSIGFLTKDYHWAIDIFLPFALIFNTLSVQIIIFSRPKKWRDYISFLIISIFLNIILYILNILQITNIKWAVTASLIYGLITLLAFIIFTPRDLKEELLRRFHT